jgi:hypothetical protein
MNQLKSLNMKILQLLILVCIVQLYGCEKSSTSADSNATANAGTGIGGSMARYIIVGNYLYTVDDKSLSVFSLANPTQPVLKKVLPVGFEIETIYAISNTLLLGSTTVIHLIDITNPENPVKLSQAISPAVVRRCDPVVAKDTFAYATLRSSGACGGGQSVLATFSIADVKQPFQLFTNVTNEPFGLGYADSTLYVCERVGLSIFSITNPAKPLFVRNINNTQWFLDVIANGDVLVCWVNDGIAFYNISNRRNPSFIKKIT